MVVTRSEGLLFSERDVSVVKIKIHAVWLCTWSSRKQKRVNMICARLASNGMRGASGEGGRADGKAW